MRFIPVPSSKIIDWTANKPMRRSRTPESDPIPSDLTGSGNGSSQKHNQNNNQQN
jgi:hypothetical protein